MLAGQRREHERERVFSPSKAKPQPRFAPPSPLGSLLPGGRAARAQATFGSLFEHQLFQIGWYANHPHQRFDVTFYNREPLIEVTLSEDFARRWRERYSSDAS